MNYSVKSVPLVILISLLHANVALAGFRLHTVEVEPTGAIPNVETNTHTAEIKTAPPAGTESAATEFVDVVAIGMGIDANSALLNAYSNAVQQALGMYVDAETLVENNEIVRDKILTHSNGFVEEAKQISTSQVNGLVQVNIRAKVKRQQLMEQVKLNNIVSVQAVDATSIHAQIMSQAKEQQDTKALLEPTLMKFAQIDMVQIKLADEPPKIEKQNGNVQFTYTILYWIDEKVYYQAARQLMSVLDKIATKKRKVVVKNDSVQTGNYGSVSFRTESIKDGMNMWVLDWHSKNYVNARVMAYSFADFDRSLIEKLRNIKQQQMTMQLSIVDDNDNPIAIEVTNLWRYPYYSYGDYSFVTRPYFHIGGNDQIYENNTIKSTTITATVANEDLPKMKAVKVELIKE